jgi:hypothetical protein
MGGDISSLGTRFIRRWALERDLGFETAHTWTLFLLSMYVLLSCAFP